MHQGPNRVVVGLRDGSELTGWIRSFTPEQTDLFVHSELRDGSHSEERRLPSESVAYVAFDSREAGPPVGPAGEAAPVRVHFARGHAFVVVPASDPGSLLGFWGVPVDPDSPHRVVYVYAHGRTALESHESLGAMLVDQGLVAKEDLDRGLEKQQSLRRRRIGEILLEHDRIRPSHLDQGLALQRRDGARLGEVLIESGLVSRAHVDAALMEQREHRGRRIGEILTEMGVLTETTLAQTLAGKFYLPFVDLDNCLIDPSAMEAIPPWILQAHRILPIEIDDEQVTVALADPLETEPIDLIRFERSLRVQEVVAVGSQIDRYRSRLLESEVSGDVAALAAAVEIETATEADDNDDHCAAESDNATIQLANQILLEAVRRSASDIHIEPNGPGARVRVRFRVDGECVAMPELPASVQHALVSRFKIMAGLDISERRKPQDGKIRFRLPDQRLELRVATIPTVGGEDVVMRVLPGSTVLDFDTIGLSKDNRDTLAGLVHRPHGMLLCVGPTGSGKSTSLHSMLSLINCAERTIWTAEDPVEITQPGLRQVQVRPKIGFGFAEALRSFLRADPDVIMIGEMRDQETAQIAVEASLTGHLVLSTLHTNSASETIVRLVEMGIDPFSFGDALLGVLAQRLVRRLCADCRDLRPADEADAKALADAMSEDGTHVRQLLWYAPGCEACRGTGYRGRVAIHELLVMDEPLRAAIHERESADRIHGLALSGGMTPILRDGAQRCLEGLTDLRQVLSVCAPRAGATP